MKGCWKEMSDCDKEMDNVGREMHDGDKEMDDVGKEMRNDNKEMDDCDKVTFVAIESEAMKAAGTDPAKPIVKKSAKKG